jgi:hypothetical protein
MVPSIVTSDGNTRPFAQNGLEEAPTSICGYQAFDHILWYVGNAKQVASYYVTRMGFKHIAYVCP